jgi:hypothetical protein
MAEIEESVARYLQLLDSAAVGLRLNKESDYFTHPISSAQVDH